ncbi:MAG: membrane integrity-associated transporter subunit PqiC [Rhizobiales bacterium]|nr:membrane integrity-associated transporter subunit PqiC [Hyphomicrobiales bacterium]
MKSSLFTGLMGILALLTLGGCSLSGAVKGALTDGTPSQTFDLVLERDLIKRSRRLGTQIVVQIPAAVKALAGDNILVKPSPTQVTYYGDAVWSDRLPKLLQARLVEALQVSGRFRAVSDGSDRISGDITLSTTIEAFQVDVEGERATANIMIFAKLIHVASGKVYASRSFKVSVPSSSRVVGDGVDALNDGMNQVLQSLTRWVVRRGQLRMGS